MKSNLKNFWIIFTLLKKTYQQWGKKFAPSPSVLRNNKLGLNNNKYSLSFVYFMRNFIEGSQTFI